MSYDNSRIVDIFNLINEINNIYSSDDYQSKIKKLTEHMQRISAQSNCYLGFDTDFKWIDYIENKISSKFKKSNDLKNKKVLKEIEEINKKFNVKII